MLFESELMLYGSTRGLLNLWRNLSGVGPVVEGGGWSSVMRSVAGRCLVRVVGLNKVPGSREQSLLSCSKPTTTTCTLPLSYSNYF
jgi:hypothetical protein